MFFVATAMVGAASCSKDDSISESAIIGRWRLPQQGIVQGEVLEIRPDHSATMSGNNLTWQLSERHFSAYGGTSNDFYHVDFTISSVSAEAMEVAGKVTHTATGGRATNHDISGSLAKETPSTHP